MSKQMATQLIKAIRQTRLSAMQLAAATGVPQPRISAFLKGDGISLSTAQKLADYLGLRLS